MNSKKDIENKKSKRSGGNEIKKPPEEVLGSFSTPEDKEFIEHSRKEIIEGLYEHSISIPVNLRKKMARKRFCLGFAPIEDDPLSNQFMAILEIQIAWLNDLKNKSVVKRFEIKNGYTRNIDQNIPPEEMIFGDVMFCPSDIIDYYETYRQIGNITPKILSSKPRFDEFTKSIYFGNLVYSFQKNIQSNKRSDLFHELWGDRKIIENGKTIKNGFPHHAGTIAVRINIVSSAQSFYLNRDAKLKLKILMKNLNTNLRRKGLPIKIISKGGIQIVVNIKQ